MRMLNRLEVGNKRRATATPNLLEVAYLVSQTRNIDVIPINIYEKNSALNFRVQSEREWTLVYSSIKNLQKRKFWRYSNMEELLQSCNSLIFQKKVIWQLPEVTEVKTYILKTIMELLLEAGVGHIKQFNRCLLGH